MSVSAGADSSTPLSWQQAYAGVPVLVLGATGFIGSHVVRMLHTLGAVVTAAARDAAVLERMQAESGVEIAVCDVTRDDDVASLLRRVEPAITFNLAGYGVDRSEREDRMAYRINGELPALLAQAIQPGSTGDWRGQALVHAGSALEYGEAGGDLREDTPPIPTTLYGRTKLQGTLALAEHSRRSGLRALTARLFTVYGPGEHAGRLLPALLETARTRIRLELTAGTQERDFTFVGDVVEGMLRLGTCMDAPGEVVNVATGRLDTVRAFAERAARVLNMDPALLLFGRVPLRAEEMAHEPVAVQRLLALTGWTPTTSIEDGVRLTLQESDPIHASN